MLLAMANEVSAHDFVATTSVGSVGVVAIDGGEDGFVVF